MIPASIPRNGFVTAVTTNVVPPTAAFVASAAGASNATVLKIPRTNKSKCSPDIYFITLKYLGHYEKDSENPKMITGNKKLIHYFI